MIRSISELLDPKFLVQNTYLFSILSVFLVMYGPRLQPNLPDQLKNVFDIIIFLEWLLYF